MMIPVMKKQPMGLAASQTIKPTPLPNQIGMPPKPVNMLNTAGVGKPVAFNGLAAKATPAVNMPQHAGVAAGTAQMVKNNAVTGQPASVNPTPAQQAAQNTADYFDRKFGGADKYAADQNKRYADAYAVNDTALMGNLIKDSQKVGYTLNTPTAQETPVLSYNDALGQANQQLDPLYQQAVAAAKAQGWTNSLDADQLGTARGGSHSGLAADLQNKVHMNTENEIKDLAAQRAAQSAQIAQDLVNRSQDNAYRDKTFNRGVFESDRTYKLQADAQKYNQDPNNPANAAQIISNKIDQLKLDNMPETLKLELEQLKQSVKSGKINLQTAEYNLKELTDPNSVTNKTKALQFQMTQIDASNYSQEAKLKLQQLQKTVDQIGKEPAVSEHDKQMQDIELKKAEIELKNLQTGQPDKPLLATDFIPIINDLPYLQDEINADGDKTGRKIVNNPDGLKSYILSLGLTDAETIKLYTAYGLPLPKGAAGK